MRPNDPATAGLVNAIVRSLLAVDATAARIAAANPWLSDEAAEDDAFEFILRHGVQAMPLVEQKALAIGLATLVSHLKTGAYADPTLLLSTSEQRRVRTDADCHGPNPPTPESAPHG